MVILARPRKEMESCMAEGGYPRELVNERGRERKGSQDVTICAICHGA